MLDLGTLVSLSQRFAEPDVGEGLVEEPVDARRYIAALRRHGRLIVGLALAVAVLVFLISHALPKRYSATAKIASSVQATAASSSSTTTPQLNLATLQAYATSPTVLAAAAREVGGESADSLRNKITTSADSSANIVNISASDAGAVRAAALANGVAETFLTARTAAERAQLAKQVSSLTRQLNAASAAGSSGLVAALQQQISAVEAQEASAGSDLELLAPAPVPSSPSSPLPTRNALFAFVAVLFIGVLVVGGRELLMPSISGGRELSALMGMPILGRVPRVTGRPRGHRAATETAEAEAYRFVSKSLELAAWPNPSRFIAVTSAGRGEGKTTVVSRLGAAFAQSGSRTLLVSADLRSPALDRAFGLSQRGGLSSFLRGPGGNRRAFESSHLQRVEDNLYVLPSGPSPKDPAAILSNDAVGSLFERLRELNFDYVLFDLPPLLAVAETQLFVRHADAAVLVTMVGRASAEQLSETRELLNRLPVWPAGIVVVDDATRRAALPYPTELDSPRPESPSEQPAGVEDRPPSASPVARDGVARDRLRHRWVGSVSPAPPPEESSSSVERPPPR